MKPLKLIALFSAMLLIDNCIYCQDKNAIEYPTNSNPEIKIQQKLNFFIISKRAKGKLDLATRYNIFRTKINGIFRKQKFVSIIATDVNQACTKILQQLKQSNATIGTVWFDSHGMYKKGYSLLFIGKDEISYKTLNDSALIIPLLKIAAIADTGSKIVVGSCYGGATYYRSSIDYKDTTRMNGDSLLVMLGEIFSKSFIYGCESWVMTKPGILKERAAVAGFPGRKLFRDICYEPVWKNLGKWNEYNAIEKKITSVNTVTLDRDGNLKIRIWPYTGHDDVTKHIRENLEELGTGLYK